MKKMDRNAIASAVAILTGITVNVLLACATYYYGIPMYFDTIGTIGVAATCGFFPGVLVAVATNFLCSIFNTYSIYYSILSVFIALFAAAFSDRKLFKKGYGVLLFIVIAAVISGGLGAMIQWALLGEPQFDSIALSTEYIYNRFHINYYLSFCIINILLNLVDKGVSTLVVIGMLHFVSQNRIEAIWNVGWKQAVLSHEDLKKIKKTDQASKGKLQRKVSRMLITAALTMTVIMGFISIQLYYSQEKAEYTNIAVGAAKIAADQVDALRVEAYVKKGSDLSDYVETESRLKEVRDDLQGIEHIYVIRIREDGIQYVFDVNTDETRSHAPGDQEEFSQGLKKYITHLQLGKEIDPVEENISGEWVVTAYYPIKDSFGNTTSYAAADIMINYLTDYVKTYVLKVLLIFSGFFVMILSYGMLMTKYHLLYPINSMASLANDFMDNSDNQTIIEDNVKKIKALDIRTDDEVENLYHAFCKMTEDTANQLHDIRHQAKMINQMQTGLIITMADLVENRDSDTGYHILKTADYVKIILDGLKKKGYYESKLTPKFIADVQMSAPLHDIGKINIPDAVLNKPGKLTDEEFEIMKGHTTAGKEIMEKAINTVQGENYLKEARNMAAYHHEKWDGSGYPEGLKGEVIPLSARIMAVADVFDALTSKRVYKDAMPFDKAMDILKKDAGTHFDPKCVEVFVESSKEVKRVLKKYQD
ncbi:MAG: HD domain-containing protein [Pseudobutyrivibrio sp.]|nr:HD domain-containing protein [Pseudobutyrivibrio sp.]